MAAGNLTYCAIKMLHTEPNLIVQKAFNQTVLPNCSVRVRVCVCVCVCVCYRWAMIGRNFIVKIRKNYLNER